MPGREVAYFDTSALAKWYLNESFSEDVERYLMEHGPVAISDLTVVEMRSLLARRRREKHVDPKLENRVFSTFEDDIRRGFLIRHPMPATAAAGAVNLISTLPDVPLRTLDAMHLVIAREIDASILATADRIMATGAHEMGFSVVRFFR
ncbi:type II toxin-antitoxin system VapC family toxin [Candidatus Deferrimicrobium sp.]|uniref:type II toxin-antitoxin system VapC family toxin n=1 Tax=Candidatus Deferrimicrobium sp. TaxID=3060586 RepID=UPI00271736B5|nr:type II toxin-antitoxin system VapC family toxin [Candidatus Deferrimicrobium sp.]MDO8739582.1 type II toxin-antitoxin system VapC family toxin [Candidatus Deferrimicrobium sp.]